MRSSADIRGSGSKNIQNRGAFNRQNTASGQELMKSKIAGAPANNKKKTVKKSGGLIGTPSPGRNAFNMSNILNSSMSEVESPAPKNLSRGFMADNPTNLEKSIILGDMIHEIVEEESSEG